jgi:hypothetical protein
MTDRQILLNLIASMGLADHMGDVAGDCWRALELAGVEIPDDIGALNELMQWLGREHGATSIWGTKITDDFSY